MVRSPNGLYIQNRTLVEIGPGGILLADVYVRTRSAKSAFVDLCLPCQHRVVLDPDGGPDSATGCDQHGAAKAAADVDEYVMRPEFDTREQVHQGDVVDRNISGLVSEF